MKYLSTVSYQQGKSICMLKMSCIKDLSVSNFKLIARYFFFIYDTLNGLFACTWKDVLQGKAKNSTIPHYYSIRGQRQKQKQLLQMMFLHSPLTRGLP